MKIVVLDGYTLNPGDLDWSPLQELGEVVIYDRTPEDLILERSQDADILLTNKTPLKRNIISQLPKLKYIGVLATGYDVVDIQEANKCDIPVSNASGYATQSVAQHTMGLILELMNRISLHDQKVKEGSWILDFSFFSKPLHELSGKTVGLVGYGRIGQKVGELAKAFGAELLIHRQNIDPNDHNCQGSLEDVARFSDVVSLHCPLKPETRKMINASFFEQMKASAILINTSRGPLVDEVALARALKHGELAGAGLDVMPQEPPDQNNPVLKAPNCIVTPHNAWTTVESRQRLMEIVVNNVKAFLDGQPANVVNQ